MIFLSIDSFYTFFMWGVESGSFYEDHIIREQNNIERSENRETLAVQKQESLEIKTSSYDNQEKEIEKQQNKEELNARFQPLLTWFKWLAASQNFEYFDVFETFVLEWLDLKLKVDFLDTPINWQQLFATIQKSKRFPVNEFEFQQALIEWGTILGNIEEDNLEWEENNLEMGWEEMSIVENNSEKIKADIEQDERLLFISSNILSLSKDLKDFDTIAWYEEYVKLASKGDKSEEDKLLMIQFHKNVISYLSQWNLLEKEILPQAQAQWPEVFDRVVQSLTALDSVTFGPRIEAFLNTPEVKKIPPYQSMRVSGALGVRVDEISEDAQQSGSVFSLDIGEGMEVNYDVMKDTRSLELDGYAIESNAQETEDYHASKLTYMREEQKLLPKLEVIRSAISAIEEKQIDKNDLAEFKATLRTIPWITDLEIDFESMEDGSAIQDALRDKFNKYNWSLQDARTVYRDELMKMRDNYAKALKEKDEKVKGVLRFFQKIGLTYVPQYVLNDVIDRINANPTLRAELGMRREVDLSRGIIWFDKNPGESNDVDLEDMQDFTNFVSQMISWNEGGLRVVLGDNEIPTFYSNDEVIERWEFERMLKNKTGTLSFHNKALQNIWLT